MKTSPGLSNTPTTTPSPDAPSPPQTQEEISQTQQERLLSRSSPHTPQRIPVKRDHSPSFDTDTDVTPRPRQVLRTLENHFEGHSTHVERNLLRVEGDLPDVEGDLPRYGEDLPPLDDDVEFLVTTLTAPTHDLSPSFALLRNNRTPSVAYGKLPEGIRTLYDLLLAKQPLTPEIYESGALKDTKKVTETEADLRCGQKLSSIVYVPHLVSRILPTAASITNMYEIDQSDALHALFVAHMLPEVPVPFLARTIYSEKDVASWCDVTILKPALAALRSVAAGKITLDDQPIFPYISSSPHRRIVPDGLLVIGEDPLAACLTIEYKSEHVLQHVFADLQNKPSYLSEGAAVLFNWPTTGNMLSCDGRSRVFIQVCDAHFTAKRIS